jgi:exosome complex RNA-binding protein Rrp4
MCFSFNFSDSKKERIAENAIRKIEAEAHSSGLTEKISKFLKENK